MKHDIRHFVLGLVLLGIVAVLAVQSEPAVPVVAPVHRANVFDQFDPPALAYPVMRCASGGVDALVVKARASNDIARRQLHDQEFEAIDRMYDDTPMDWQRPSYMSYGSATTTLWRSGGQVYGSTSFFGN